MKERPLLTNQDLVKVYGVAPLIDAAILRDIEKWEVVRAYDQKEVKSIVQKRWGIEIGEEMTIHPSTAANCLRWVGYQALGYKGMEKTLKQAWSLTAGASLHRAILGALRGVGDIELPWKDPQYNLSGRMDFLMRNRLTGEYQVADLKIVSGQGFRQIESLGGGNYRASAEARLQVLLYMWEERKRGLPVEIGNVIYLNISDLERKKECIFLWTPELEYQVEQFLLLLKDAIEKIKSGEIPEATVKSKHVCKFFCPYLKDCEFGRRFVGGLARVRRKPTPAFVRVKAKEKERQVASKLVELGVKQPELPLAFGDDTSP